MEEGENFSTIARTVYGDSKYYLAILKANPDVDPTRLRPGTVINLPDPETVKRGTGGGGNSGDSSAEKELDPERQYRVKSNDSLYKIAVERYGTSNMIDEIYELNRDAIGPDQSRLKLGMVLKMPPKRDASAAPAR